MLMQDSIRMMRQQLHEFKSALGEVGQQMDIVTKCGEQA